MIKMDAPPPAYCRRVVEGREIGDQYSFYYLGLSMTVAELVKKGCPERGELQE